MLLGEAAPLCASAEEIGAGYMDEAIVADQVIYDRINNEYGTDFEQRRQDRR